MNIFQEPRCRAWSLNLNVISLSSSQEIDSLAKKKKKSRGKVGVVLILAYGKVVKILEEQACLPFKEEFIFQNDHIKVIFVSYNISRISDSKGGGIFLS